MDGHGVDAHHITPIRTYVITYILLGIGLLLTYVAAEYDLGILNNIVAMAIAVAKAVAVVLIFMGVKYSTKLTKFWAAIGFVWFILLFGIFGDYLTRNWNKIIGWQ